MSGIYVTARNAMLIGQLDVVTDALMAQLVGAPFVYSENDTDLTAISGRIGTPMPVSITEVTNGEAHCAPVLFPSVPDGVSVSGVLTYRAGVDDAGSMLIGFADRRADAVPLNPLPGTGGDLLFDFVDYLLKI